MLDNRDVSVNRNVKEYLEWVKLGSRQRAWGFHFGSFISEVGEAPNSDCKLSTYVPDKGFLPGNVYWTQDRVKTIDMTGRKIKGWTVRERDYLAQLKDRNRAYWYCECSCGKVKSIMGNWLRNGKVKSCGCDKKHYDELIELHCSSCNKMLGKISGKAEIKCPRCKTINIQ